MNGPGPDVFLARNETAVALYPLLQRRRPRNARFVYEAHRLCFAHLAEHLTGRRWHQEDSLGWGVRRLREREDAVVNGADAIVCLTEGVKQTLTSVFRPGRPIFVLPSGVSAREGRASPCAWRRRA